MGKNRREKGGVPLLRRPLAWWVPVFMVFACSAVAAVISLQPEELTGAYVTVPVAVYSDGTEDIAGLQFDVRFDSDALTLVDVAAGATVVEADKDVVVYDQGVRRLPDCGGWSEPELSGPRRNRDAHVFRQLPRCIGGDTCVGQSRGFRSLREPLGCGALDPVGRRGRSRRRFRR